MEKVRIKKEEQCGKVKVKGVKKKVRMCYSRENLLLAVKEVLEGSSIASASKKYNVPEATIRARKNNKYADKKPGPASVLSASQEADLVEWVMESCRRGFPVTKPQLFDSVKKICDDSKKKTPFIDNRPGRTWYDSFVKRHPEISHRLSENSLLNRSRVSETSLRTWFQDVKKYFMENNLLSLEPTRIFTCQEMRVPLNPTSLTALELKNSDDLVENSEKENISVLITANAAGNLAPTFVLFSGNALPKNAMVFAPSEFTLGNTENGWMTSEVFYNYIVNQFEPWLNANKIKRPVIFFINGDSSLVTLHLNRYCSKNQIVLISLLPNTIVTQPLDIWFFKKLKIVWQQIHENICNNFFTIGIEKYQFAPNLKKVLDTMDIKKLLQNGFKNCGIYPLDANSVDYTKLETKNILTCKVTKDDPPIKNNRGDYLKMFENALNEDQLETFRLNRGLEWKGSIEDTNLFKIWYRISNPFHL